MLQGEFRRLLELLGQGRITELLSPPKDPPPQPDGVIDEIVDAVKGTVPNRTGGVINS